MRVWVNVFFMYILYIFENSFNPLKCYFAYFLIREYNMRKVNEQSYTMDPEFIT